MERVLSPEEMSRTDLAAQQKLFVDGLVLMERAALFAHSLLYKNDTVEFDLARVLVVAGCGNNGGDALALARLFYEEGRACDIYICGSEDKGTESFKVQKKSLMAYGAVFIEHLPEDKNKYTTIIDGLFGISLNREIGGAYLEAVEYINASAARVLALDMPSGIHAGNGQLMGAAVKADVTATFGFKKRGQLLYPGAEYCGGLYAAHIGITEKALPEDISKVYTFEEEEIVFPERPAYSNKGTFGKVLLIAGSENISGACLMAGMAAMRSGAGMLKIITHENNRELLSNALCESMYYFYGDEICEDEVIAAADWCDVIIIGPGMGTGEAAGQLVDIVLSSKRAPVIMDADALNIIARSLKLQEDRAERFLNYSKGQPPAIVVTPHLGEMSRLIKRPIKEIAADLIGIALEFSREYNCVCVLKDARTVIAEPGGRAIINTTGNSGMATAGSGDVLTGIIAALAAGGKDIFEAAALGAALHGHAGDRGSSVLSEKSLMARDIIKYLKE